MAEIKIEVSGEGATELESGGGIGGNGNNGIRDNNGNGGNGFGSGDGEVKTSMWGCFIKNIKLLFSIFKGRAGRKEYWSAVVFSMLISALLYAIVFIFTFVFAIFKISFVLAGVFVAVGSLVMIAFGIITSAIYFSVFVKRLHDLGISARVFLSILASVSLIISLLVDFGIIGNIAFIIIMVLFSLFAIIYLGCVKGKDEENKYGLPIR